MEVVIMAKSFEHKLFKSKKINDPLDYGEFVVDLKDYLKDCKCDSEGSLTCKLKKLLEKETCMYDGFKTILEFAAENKRGLASKLFSKCRIDKLLKFATRADVVKYNKFLNEARESMSKLDVDYFLKEVLITKDQKILLGDMSDEDIKGYIEGLGVFFQLENNAKNIIELISKKRSKEVEEKQKEKAEKQKNKSSKNEKSKVGYSQDELRKVFEKRANEKK